MSELNRTGLCSANITILFRRGWIIGRRLQFVPHMTLEVSVDVTRTLKNTYRVLFYCTQSQTVLQNVESRCCSELEKSNLYVAL